MLTSQNFLARKHFFHFEQGKNVKVLLCIQVLKKKQTFLIKMNPPQNSIIEHFEFVKKGKKKFTK